jgi:hypothetical protein
VGVRDAVWVFLGSVLLVAAGLKAYQTATRPSVGGDFLSSPPVVAFVVGLEVGLGLMLVVGSYPRTTRRITLVCFTAFAGVASYKTVAGDSSCGCFGQVQVAPWQILAFDVAAITALAACGPVASGEAPGQVRRYTPAFAASAAVAAAAAVVALAAKPATVAADGEFVGSGRAVVLLPKDWVGKPFPLLRHIEIAEDLGSGRWTVILYQRDCPKCRDALARYRARGSEHGARLALVEVSPQESPESPDPGAEWVYGRLTGTKDWFVELPVRLELIDGKVSFVQTREGV